MPRPFFDEQGEARVLWATEFRQPLGHGFDTRLQLLLKLFGAVVDVKVRAGRGRPLESRRVVEIQVLECRRHANGCAVQLGMLPREHEADQPSHRRPPHPTAIGCIHRAVIRIDELSQRAREPSAVHVPLLPRGVLRTTAGRVVHSDDDHRRQLTGRHEARYGLVGGPLGAEAAAGGVEDVLAIMQVQHAEPLAWICIILRWQPNRYPPVRQPIRPELFVHDKPTSGGRGPHRCEQNRAEKEQAHGPKVHANHARKYRKLTVAGSRSGNVRLEISTISSPASPAKVSKTGSSTMYWSVSPWVAS